MVDANNTANLKKTAIARQFGVDEKKAEEIAATIKVNG